MYSYDFVGATVSGTKTFLKPLRDGEIPKYIKRQSSQIITYEDLGVFFRTRSSNGKENNFSQIVFRACSCNDNVAHGQPTTTGRNHENKQKHLRDSLPDSPSESSWASIPNPDLARLQCSCRGYSRMPYFSDAHRGHWRLSCCCGCVTIAQQTDFLN